MSEIIKNRYDFSILFDVTDGNPNGDPDRDNMPRMDDYNRRGLQLVLGEFSDDTAKEANVRKGGAEGRDNPVGCIGGADSLQVPSSSIWREVSTKFNLYGLGLLA